MFTVYLDSPCPKCGNSILILTNKVESIDMQDRNLIYYMKYYKRCENCGYEEIEESIEEI